MQLQQFVTESLKQIVLGVSEAQKACEGTGARISPDELTFRKGESETMLWDSKTGRGAEPVEFDVAVTTSEGKGTKGSIGIFVGPVGIGSQGQSEHTNSSISRIKFKVLVIFPAT